MNTINKVAKVIDFMAPIKARCTIESSFQEALHLFHQHHLSHLVVEDEKGIIGVISKEDLLSKSLNLLLESTGMTYALIQLRTMKVDQFMTKSVVSLNEDATMEEAINILLEERFHCLPIIDNSNKTIGIITTIDIVKFYENKGEN